MYADLMLTRDRLLDEHPTANPRRQGEIADQLASIDRVLDEDDEDYTDDALIDKWEREIAEGKIPDLNEEDPDA